MLKLELLELVGYGENSRVEFKRDDISPGKLAAEMAALLNLEGGHILLGVEDDGTVTGLTRPSEKAEEWVMEAARHHVQPATIPAWQTIPWDEGLTVGIVSLPRDAPDKPYKAKRGSAWVTKMRVGTTTRDATREEEERLYQQSGRLRYGCKPVLGAGIEALDRRRLRDYFGRVLEMEYPGEGDVEEWRKLLINLELATGELGKETATIDGMLLFGKQPKRFVGQSGIRAVCYPGPEADYAVRADEDLRGPLVPLGNREGEEVVERGLVDQAWDFVQRNTSPSVQFEGARRIDRWEYPREAVREAVVNALVHRDYSIWGSEVTVELYSDRIEIRSPGRLPNSVTPTSIRSGNRYARNQNLVSVMRDYGYVEARGMGVRRMIIPGMKAHNGTEPDLIEDENSFMVRLWKDRPSR